MITFIVSAFWHGVYPFYYPMFFNAAILNEINKDLYRMWFVFAWIPTPLRLFLCHLGSFWHMNFSGIMFAALTFENGMKFGNATYWFVPGVGAAFLIISRTFNFVGMAKKS